MISQLQTLEKKLKMQKITKSFTDIQSWIEKVIDSCQTLEHTKTTKNLIHNFQNQILERINDHNLMTIFTKPLIIKLKNKEKNLYLTNSN